MRGGTRTRITLKKMKSKGQTKKRHSSKLKRKHRSTRGGVGGVKLMKVSKRLYNTDKYTKQNERLQNILKQLKTEQLKKKKIPKTRIPDEETYEDDFEDFTPNYLDDKSITPTPTSIKEEPPVKTPVEVEEEYTPISTPAPTPRYRRRINIIHNN